LSLMPGTDEDQFSESLSGRDEQHRYPFAVEACDLAGLDRQWTPYICMIFQLNTLRKDLFCLSLARDKARRPQDPSETRPSVSARGFGALVHVC
jgi:hypothetical protein